MPRREREVEEPKKKAAKKIVDSSDDSSDDVPVAKPVAPKNTAASKKAAAAAKKPAVSDDSSDDDVPVKYSSAKGKKASPKASPKSSPKLSPVKKGKKAAAVESDDDSDDIPKMKAPVAKKTSKAAAAAAAAAAAQEEEDEGVATEAAPVAAAKKGKVASKKSAIDDGSDAAKKDVVEGAVPLDQVENLSDSMKKALVAKGINTLFPVQAETFATIFSGQEVLVQSRTGSGKTLAFGIPIMERLAAGPHATRVTARGRGPYALVFCPTRELAIQVRDVMQSIARQFVVRALYGGAAFSEQEVMLRGGIDVAVCTPGRANDFVQRGQLKLNETRVVCLDEADHMLDIGFKDVIEELLKAVAKQNGSTDAANKGGKPVHQMVLFSATVPQWVHTCSFLGPEKERKFFDFVGRGAVKAADTIKFFKRKCKRSEVPGMLADLIRVYSGKHGRTLVFTNTKRDCHDLTINNTLKLDAQALHGDMQQDQREATMKSFHANGFSVLIATDVAARGLDIPRVDLVIQAAPPSDIDAFIHRAGRTGRAGRQGVCVLLHTAQDQYVVEKCERHAKIKFETLPPPSQADILKAVGRDVIEDLARVEHKATELFRGQAEELLLDADPTEILASALAVMSGYTQNIHKRGLLTGVEGFATMLVKSSRPTTIPMYCSQFRRALGDDVFMQCKDITLLKDEPGCCFDIPEAMIGEVLKVAELGAKEVDILPTIIERENVQYMQYGGRGGGGRGYGGGYGGGRGGGRGFGGGGGGYGGGGGGGYGGGRGGGYGGGGGRGGGYGGGRGGGGGGFSGGRGGGNPGMNYAARRQ